MPKKHILGLDIARFFAAISVMLYHLGALYLRDPSKPYLKSVISTEDLDSHLLNLFKYGWIGVQIFFVISGMVIGASMIGRSRWDYARSRILRLYPGVWVCTFISMLCVITTHQSAPETWLPLWVRSSVIFPLAPWVDGAYWTLPIEITFYSAMLVCIGQSRRISVGLAVTLCMISTAFWLLYISAPEHSRITTWIHKTAGSFRFDLAFIQYGIYFGIGILIQTYRSTTTRLMILAVTSPICFIQISKISQHAGEYINTPMSSWIPFTIWVASVVFLLNSEKWNEHFHTRISMTGIRVIRRIGLATYPLYLLHVTVGFATIAVASHLGMSPFFCWMLGIVAPIPLALWVADSPEPMVRQKTAKLIDWLGRNRSYDRHAPHS